MSRKTRKRPVRGLALVGLLAVVGCASAPPAKPNPVRKLQRLHRQTYCGNLTVEADVPRLGMVVTELRVCAARRETCQKMLRSFAAPTSQVEEIVFDWKSCRAQEHDRVDAPERRLLKSRRK